MTTVSVCKRAGFTPFFQRSFESVSDVLGFVESWRGFHVTIQSESGPTMTPCEFIRANKADEPAMQPPADGTGDKAVCPFCGAAETPILADDDLLHACETCGRDWYIDDDGNVLPADRCPSCESPDVSVDERGARTCGACGHAFFFDGLTYVDPATVEAEESGVQA